MPTYSSDVLPSASGINLGSASLRWNLYVQNLDCSGTITLSGSLGIANLEGIRFADQFSGATVTNKIDAALADATTLLVVVPSTMGAGNATTITSGKCILDLRSGVPKLFTAASVSTASVQLTDAGVLKATAFSTQAANPATSGVVRLASAEVIATRDALNSANITLLGTDGSDNILVGSVLAGSIIFTVNSANSILTFTGTQLYPSALAAADLGIASTNEWHNLYLSNQLVSSVATGTAPFSITSTTVVPNLNVQVVNGVTVSGVPSASQVLTATSGSAASWATPASTSTFKTESVNSTTVTVASTNVETALMTFALPVNELAAGQALKIWAWGSYASVAAPTLTIKLKDGANTWESTGAATAAATGFWSITAYVICSTAGAGGTIEVQGWWQSPDQSLGVSPTGSTRTVSTFSFDTTAPHTIQVTAQWSVASASNTTTQRQMIIERLG